MITSKDLFPDSLKLVDYTNDGYYQWDVEKQNFPYGVIIHPYQIDTFCIWCSENIGRFGVDWSIGNFGNAGVPMLMFKTENYRSYFLLRWS